MDKTPDINVEAEAVENQEETFTGRVVALPDDVRFVVFALFGIQSKDPGVAEPYIAALREMLAGSAGDGAPKLVERAHYEDPDGYHNQVFMAYWLDVDGYRAWAGSPEVAAWWAGLPSDHDSELGFWREVLMPDKDRFEFGGAGDRKAASASFLDLKPSDKFGYWGGYRDRLRASVHDDFAPEQEQPDAPEDRKTKGRRLTVVTPDNLCFLREGQGWADCGAEELRIWDESMEEVVTDWVGFLRDQPHESGCLSMRDCREQDVVTGDDVDRRSQFAFMQSLGHIEHAARTQPTHLAVRDTFLKMHADMSFEPQMHIWVEVFVLKADELQTEYVNCHSRTGLLPYFELRDA